MTKNQYPIYVDFNCNGIQVEIQNDAQFQAYIYDPERRRTMEIKAIFKAFFPNFTEADIKEMRLPISSRESIPSVYEKIRAAAVEAARRQEIIEAAVKAAVAAVEAARGRQNITQDTAAQICGVSIRTIKRWDKRPPDWYPGRNVGIVEFTHRAKFWKSEKELQTGLRDRLKNAVSLERITKGV